VAALSEYEILLDEYRYLHDREPERADGRAWPVWGNLQTRAEQDAARKELYAALHRPRRSAFCLSGGGIRSATFGLGVAQRLARLGLLGQFEYLSTVSGGGYIGAWLSSFAKRDPAGIIGVQEKIAPPRRSAVDPEPVQLRHLREYSNYLTPRLGLFSGDTWAAIGTYLRNVSLMWLILVPLFIAALAVPRLLVGIVRWVPPPSVFYATVAFAVTMFVAALSHMAGSRPVGREWTFWRKSGEDAQKYLTNKAFLLRTITPLTLCSVAMVFVYAWSNPYRAPWGLANWQAAGCLAGLAAVASAALAGFYMWRYRRSGDQDAKQSLAPGQTVKQFKTRKTWWEVGAASASGAVLVGAIYWLLQTLFPLEALTSVPAPKPEDWLSIGTIFPPPMVVLFVCFAVPLAIFALLVQATIFIAGTSDYNEEYDREWWARSGAWCLVVQNIWIALTAISLLGPVGVYFAPRTISGIGMITGGFAVLFGRSEKTSGSRKDKANESLLGKSLNISLGAAVPLFILCLFSFLSLGTTELIIRMQHEAATATKPSAVPPPALTDLQLLERTAWHLEATSTTGTLGPVERKFKSIDLPALESDKYKARRHLFIVESTPARTVFWVIVVAGGLSLAGSFFVGVNRFSMHGLYRNRLTRAYLGASNRGRKPNPFTGFDPADNLAMSELRPDHILPEEIDEAKVVAIVTAPSTPEEQAIADAIDAETLTKNGADLRSALAADLRKAIADKVLTRKRIEKALGPAIHHSTKKPMHVVNIALNLVGGDDLAWQERKAESFTASPLHCGSPSLGYRRSAAYGGGISLGTAVTISGAAASPNMGYHSSPALAFLLTFFNVRLGAWLGNPGPKGEKTYELRNPRWSFDPLFAELSGAADAGHPYVYLSDGGHFENLGLYEMVRRRCHWIVISDAGQDEEFAFEDLGNAIRKIRIDFGIDIKVRYMGIYPRKEKNPQNPKYCAIAEICYEDVDAKDKQDAAKRKVMNGWLVYIKPVFYGKDEPKDIFNYATANQAFPHETTGDQFFTESQFESYRALGEFATSAIAQEAGSVEEFIENAIAYAKREERARAAKKMVDRLRKFFGAGT